MFDNMRRLHPCGPTNRGIAVDGHGAILGPASVLVRRTASGHLPIAREAAEIVQGLLLRDHQDPDWLFRQCGRIARALDDGEVALAQIYGLRIPIDELDDRGLAQLGRITAFARAGFNPDEPRLPKGDPHGGEWTSEGSSNGRPASISSPTQPDLGSDTSSDGGDDEGGSGSSSAPSDLGGGGSDDDGGGSNPIAHNALPMPQPAADASDAPQQIDTDRRTGKLRLIRRAFDQNPEPTNGSPPAADNPAPTTGIPTPLDSADLDHQIDLPAPIPATTSEPAADSASETGGEQVPSVPNPETSVPGLQPLDPPPQFPAERPETTRQVNAILRSTAVWLGRAASILGPLLSSDPRVRLVWMALDAIGWLAENAPKIVSYLDGPKSLSELQDAVDHRAPGYEVHHIVEAQRWSDDPNSNWKRFPDRINSRANLVRVPYWKHVEISTYTQSKGGTERQKLGSTI
jgi:hypothetical protein